ncbi:hypothetical protein MASR2M18_12530 [Ignavibacteria bacterium]|nr:ribonuclease P protein component [Bacteroidota bacterium]MCZ2132205.1 ribonuclease P protein component [Bacteroidota bacterium]
MTVVSLKGKSRIANVFRFGRRFSSPQATVIAMRGGENRIVGGVELMAVIRKKTARKSVVRNRIRRLVRESLRRIAAEYADAGREFPARTIIVLWNFAPAHPALLRLDTVMAVLRPLLERACKFHSKSA